MNLVKVLRASLLALTTYLISTSLAFSTETMRQYQFEKSDGKYQLKMVSVPVPEIAPEQILVRVHAVSLNRRDMYILEGGNMGRESTGLVPLSDGAGEIIAVGKDVTQFKLGDRVAGTFFTEWVEGKSSQTAFRSARGGDVPGMLSEMIVATERSLIKIPEHLSYAEAATLPCAGLTAWNGLFRTGSFEKEDYVLLEGTGGVSSFGLLFANAIGAKAIITSSKDEKLAKAKQLGAVGTVNYRKRADWEVAVRELTHGVGVDRVLEVVGKEALQKASAALAHGGHIASIGNLNGRGAALEVAQLIRRSASMSGIYVGSKAEFQTMNSFIEEHKIRPLIDRVFAFEDAAAAYDYMKSSNFMGKIVISLEPS